MEGDCNVYAHSSLWMRPTGEWSINAKMVYRPYHFVPTESHYQYFAPRSCAVYKSAQRILKILQFCAVIVFY